MKAKVKATGEIVDVYERYDDYAGETHFEPIIPYYRPDELDLNVEDPEEVTIEGWVVRDANPHSLRFFDRQPARLSDMWGSVYSYYNTMQLDPIMFPSVTWESEPQKVKITITPIQ